MKRVALYGRVSTNEQTCENQVRDLREHCRARGWTEVRGFHGLWHFRPEGMPSVTLDFQARGVASVLRTAR